MEAPSSEETNKKRPAEEGLPLSDVDTQTELPLSLGKDGSLSSASSKKQQNTVLLLNAMRTTAAHSNRTFELHTQQIAASESVKAETPVTATRSSATPGPSVSASGPQVTLGTSGSQETAAAKSAPGTGKKKKKRKPFLNARFSQPHLLFRHVYSCIRTDVIGNGSAQ